MAQNAGYLKGLNTLRFFAAFFVILAHGHRSLMLLGVLGESKLKMFDRGGMAVELFFTLSGFLITYLLLMEIRNTKTVNIRFFYFRRIIRIWPLYFLCLAAGTIVLKVLIPRITGETIFHFRLWLFVLFLPNLSAFYDKVGLLFPLWSIGIEEQFYLFWAPLVRIFRRCPLRLITAGIVITTSAYCTLAFAVHGHIDPSLEGFLTSIKFHNMLIGALFAYVAAFRADRYRQSFLARPIMQVLLLLVILYHYLVGIYPIPDVLVSILMSFVYGCVFVNLSSITRPVTDLEFQPFTYLGEISFGLYIYHMFVDYALRLSFQHIKSRLNPYAESAVYLILLLLITIAVASLSYRYFESFFLNLRKRYKARGTG